MFSLVTVFRSICKFNSTDNPISLYMTINGIKSPVDGGSNVVDPPDLSLTAKIGSSYGLWTT